MKKTLPLLLTPLLLAATDYGFVDLDHPWLIERCYPWHLEADGRMVGKADLKRSSVKDSTLRYADSHLFGYYSRYFTPRNALSLQVGYTYMHLGWKNSRRIEQENYHLGVASLALISNQFNRWRWILNLGATVDTTTFDFSASSVVYGMAWGRYALSEDVGLHIGAFSFSGVHTTYTLPIVGVDWQIAPQWRLNAVFPIEGALYYFFTPSWSLEASWTTFGGPYRYPWRVNGGSGRFKEGIVEVYSNGVELDLNYNYCRHLFAGVGAGWNFGGWLFVRDREGHNGNYYKFKSAPYAQANLALTF